MDQLPEQRLYQDKNSGESPSNCRTPRGKGRTLRSGMGHKPRCPSTTIDPCNCDKPLMRSDRQDQKCAGCQNNIRRI